MQLTIQHYNALSYNFKHYELQMHKLWYDNVNRVVEYLTQPVLIFNPATNCLEVNFHDSIFELIKESETMIKLGLAVPHLSNVMVKFRNVLLQSKETLQSLVERNNEIRSSFDMTLVSIARPLLRKLDIVFKPGLARIQWHSADLRLYVTFVKEVSVLVHIHKINALTYLMIMILRRKLKNTQQLHKILMIF